MNTDHAEFKSLAATIKAVESDNPNGEFEAILSTSDVDRDGEVIAPGAFEPLPKSIPIFHSHDWRSGALPIGKGTPFYDGDTLKVKGVFGSSARAQEVRNAVNEGLVDSMSVGFVNGTKAKVDGKSTITKGDLFESSFTGIPVNPSAAVLASKALMSVDEIALEGVKAGARNSATDQGHIQAAHDALVNAGADCGMNGKSITSTKTIAGSYEERVEEITDALLAAHHDELVALFPNADEGDLEWRISVIATFDDRVVYQLGWDDEHQYQATYTYQGDVVTLGPATAVEIEQVVTSPDNAAAADVAAAKDLADEDAIAAMREFYETLAATA